MNANQQYMGDEDYYISRCEELEVMIRQQQAEIEAQKADATKWFLKYQECFVHGIKEAK
jgi:hypothetical protein